MARLELAYVVLTMVDRDDLLDGGADHVARTVRRLRELRPDILIETLVGDFHGHMSAVETVTLAAPDVFAHNVETVRRLTRTVRDVRCSYDQSLAVLRRARELAAGKSLVTKSSVMVGLGETDEEVLETLADLRAAGVDVVTLGQYLRPTPKHHEVVRYVEPATFDAWQKAALDMGFLYAASGPLVRSSYRAAEVFVRSLVGEEAGGRAPTLEERLERAKQAAARIHPATDTRTGAPARLAPGGPDRLAPGGLVPAGLLVRRA
jgi:lipoic acid synthetase